VFSVDIHASQEAFCVCPYETSEFALDVFFIRVERKLEYSNFPSAPWGLYNLYNACGKGKRF
jgi:hypothetical protein